jgi:hypothetical protein
MPCKSKYRKMYANLVKEYGKVKAELLFFKLVQKARVR